MKASIKSILQTLALGSDITAQEVQELKQEVITGAKAQADAELAEIKAHGDGIVISVMKTQITVMESCQRTAEAVSLRHQQSACRLFMSINDKAQLSIVESSDTEAQKQLKLMNEAYIAKLDELSGVNDLQCALVKELRDYIKTLECNKANPK